METLGLDLEDDSLKGTPVRVAKMYVSELFKGLDPAAAPDISTFDNHYQYNRVLIERISSSNPPASTTFSQFSVMPM